MTKLGNIRLSYLVPRGFTGRLVLGVVFGGGFINGMQAVWVDLARDHRWVGQHAALLVYGTRAVGLVILAAFLLQRWTKPLSKEGPSRGT